MSEPAAAVEERVRALEAFRARLEGMGQVQEHAMNERLKSIDEHLCAQDEKIDRLSTTVSRWAGALTLAGIVVSVAVALVEVLRR